MTAGSGGIMGGVERDTANRDNLRKDYERYFRLVIKDPGSRKILKETRPDVVTASYGSPNDSVVEEPDDVDVDYSTYF